jgi:hypothetical protein
VFFKASQLPAHKRAWHEEQECPFCYRYKCLKRFRDCDFICYQKKWCLKAKLCS